MKEIINKIQKGEGLSLSGIILSNGNEAYELLFPREDIPQNRNIESYSLDEWKDLLLELDDRYIKIMYPDGGIKAVIRKCQRIIDEKLKWKVYKEANYTCEYCNTTGIPLTIDHYYPQEKGGETIKENLKCACRKCNKRKGNMLPEEWEAYLVNKNCG